MLAGDATVDEALQTWGPDGLQVMLSGQLPPNPSEMLGSLAAEELFVVLSNRFDTVIVDCPPLLPVTDAAIIARYFEGAIMVAGSGKVQVREFRRSLQMLDSAGVPLLGVIANRTSAEAETKYQRIYAASAPEPEADERQGHGSGPAAASGTAASGAMPTPGSEPANILVVCTGNICRSPYMQFTLTAALAAAGVDDIVVASAGTHAVPDSGVAPHMAALLRADGLDVDGYATRQLTAAMVADADIVLTAERAHRKQVVLLDPRALGRTFTLLQFGRLLPSPRRRADTGRSSRRSPG